MNTKKSEEKFDIYEMITERLISKIEKEKKLPWRQPWFNVNDGAFSHRDGKCYSLLNQVMLGDNHEYITWNEIQKEKGKLKKGSEPKYVFFWKVFSTDEKDKDGNLVKDENGNVKQISFPVLRYYKVYDIADTENIKPRERKVGKAEEVPVAEDIVKEYISRSGVTLKRKRTSNEAYYAPATDTIVVPCKKQYDSTAAYYSTMFHEMTHSTGHPKRLHRFDTGTASAAFGSTDYSKEELVAELGAASLTNYCQLEVPESFNNSVAYVESWLSALKNDKRLIVSATSRAQKAINLILNVEK